MRAVAAACVALYHFQQRVPHLDARLPRFVSVALQHGNLGVQMFFVLSGFAVARSLATTRLDLSGLGRFMLRRAIRLDPPYVFTVLLVACLAVRHPSVWPVPPTPGLVAAHMVYAQGLLGMPHLQGVFWTLCIEIQLYLALAVAVALAQRAGAANDRRFDVALVASALIAASVTWTVPHTSTHLLPFWPIFALGVLVERATRMTRESRPSLFVLAGVLLLADIANPQLEVTAGLATASVLFAATRGSGLSRVLSSRALLALGRRSYSFYLLHALVGGIAFDLVASASAVSDVARLAFAIAASAAAAMALHHTIEVPAQRISRKLGEPAVGVAVRAPHGSAAPIP